jgi:hypothetical protein
MMVVVFEKCKSKPEVIGGNTPVKQEGADNTAPVNDKKAQEKVEKERLQKILTDAGVEFAKNSGVKKLQELVDGLPKD